MRYIISLLFTAMLAISMPLYAVDDTVYINTANAAELEKELNGVTEEIAKRIVEYRKTNGPFFSKEDLLKVRGVGRDILNLNKRDISVQIFWQQHEAGLGVS